ncbi:cytosine permease, partial [Escherichia coli]
MEHQRKLFQQRGYSEDLLPKTQSQRTWKTFNYFTLWMGSVHNVPNYVMVGGFFILGLSTFSIMLAIILSAFFIAAVMVLGNDSNLLIVFYVQIMPDDFVMQLH